MSALKRMSFLQKRKEKRKQMQKLQLEEATGICFGEEVKAEKQGFPWFKYVVNAIALFCSTYGALMCMITSFRLTVQQTVFCGFCAILAVLLSFMYASQKSKIAVYLLVLGLCLLCVTKYYYILNSGMSAIHNVCLEKINDISELPALQKYYEYDSHRMVTMTAALCALATALMIVINIFISEFMNTVFVILLTLPIAQMGMYFSMQPSVYAIAALIGSWLLVMFLGRTGAYNGVQRKLRSRNKVKRRVHFYGFVTDSVNMSYVGISCFLFLLAFFTVLMTFVPQSDFQMSTKLDVVKEETNDVVKDFLSYGFFAFQKNSTQDAGRIANQRAIHYDGKEDLQVTLTTGNNERIYLRSYTGSVYKAGEFSWLHNIKEDRTLEENFPGSVNRTGKVLAFDYIHNREAADSSRKMQVMVKDPDLIQQALLYVPYYSLLDEKTYRFRGTSAVLLTPQQKISQEYSYYTKENSTAKSTIRDIYYKKGKKLKGADTWLKEEKQYYNTVVRPYNLTIDEENQKVIAQICKKEKLSPDSDHVVNDVIAYLSKNYKYTLRPGRVPQGKDFVNYFLAENKKGYCEHFASAAVLMLRYLGVPARYAQGYVIDPEDMERAKALPQEKVKQWNKDAVSGEQVVTVSLSDANAHAWVEIYEYGLGWVPVEATLASSDEADTGIFSEIFNNTGAAASDTGKKLTEQVSKLAQKRTWQKIMRFLLFVLGVFVGIYILKMSMTVFRRRRWLKAGDYNTSLSRRYEYLDQVWRFKCEETVTNLSYAQFSAMLLQKEYLTKEEQEWFYHTMERAVFSRAGVSRQEYETMTELLKHIVKQIRKQLTWKQKVQFYITKILW